MSDPLFPPPSDSPPGPLPERRPGYLATLLPPAPLLWPDFLKGQEGAPVRVLLVDNDEFVRRVIAQELLSDLRIQLEGQAGSLRDARKLLAAHEFDVLLTDLRLGDGMGFELITETRQQHPHAEIIVISALEDDAHMLHAFALGATGYLLKNAWLQSFSQGVLQVVNGGAAVTPRLVRRMLGRLDLKVRDTQEDRAQLREPTLTPRECEILRSVARGYVTTEIGAKLGITGQTVNAHMKSIYKKLHVHSRAQAVSRATHNGLI